MNIDITAKDRAFMIKEYKDNLARHSPGFFNQEGARKEGLPYWFFRFFRLFVRHIKRG